MNSAPAHTPLLEVERLSVAFFESGAYHDVTHQISFKLERGEVLGIVGESGSGKSVSSLAIMGLLPTDFSKISSESSMRFQFDEQIYDLAHIDRATHRRLRGRGMSMIFQEPMSALNPVMRCGEQVAEGIRLHQPELDETAVQQKVLGLFEEVLLPRPAQIMRSYPHELSGGQRQRVMIAMALACDPALLIADEPTTALDVTVQATILELLRQLSRKRQLGVIFITHDLGVVAQLADQVLVLYRGQQMEYGPTTVVFQTPKSAYTRALLACRPVMEIRVNRLLTVADFNDEKAVEVKPEPISERVKRHEWLYKQEALLQVTNLHLNYVQSRGLFKAKEVVRAVDGVSFEVYPHETLGLVGESGSGKSTIGKLVAGLIAPSSGELCYQGKSYAHFSSEEKRVFRRSVQVIFQDPYGSLNPRMTVFDAIAEPIRVHQLRHSTIEVRKRVHELLEEVGLTAAASARYPHEFSGGQRQRIVIARCLALEPSFIICDESVSALDVSVQAQVLNLLKSLQEKLGLTYIFISHDLSVVKHIADRVMVLRAGKCEEIQEADKLYLQPESEYSRKLIAAIPVLTT
jgi:peptide/nickel transport system ATP-binding protein